MRKRRLWLQTAIATGLVLAIATNLPSQAQTPDTDKPFDILPNRPADKNAEGPPPLILDGARNSPSESDAKSSGTRWRDYAVAVNKSVETAIAANEEIRSALATDYVRSELWIDPTGRVARVNLVKAFGKAKLDATLRDNIFPKLNLPAPAKDMPMPVKVTIGTR